MNGLFLIIFSILFIESKSSASNYEIEIGDKKQSSQEKTKINNQNTIKIPPLLGTEVEEKIYGRKLSPRYLEENNQNKKTKQLKQPDQVAIEHFNEQCDKLEKPTELPSLYYASLLTNILKVYLKSAIAKKKERSYETSKFSRQDFEIDAGELIKIITCGDYNDVLGKIGYPGRPLDHPLLIYARAAYQASPYKDKNYFKTSDK